MRDAKPDHPHRLNADRQRHILNAVTEILREGRPTYFAFEGPCRHGLRIRLISEGWRWANADSAAAEMVARALKMIGAVRPSWYQGQPRYVEDGYAPAIYVRCRRCHRPLSNAMTEFGYQSPFCSNACRVATRRNVDKKTREDYYRALRAAGEVKRLKRLTTCPNCGVKFLPKKPQWPPDPTKPRYCCNRCSKVHFFVKRREMQSSARLALQ